MAPNGDTSEPLQRPDCFSLCRGLRYMMVLATWFFFY